MTILQSDLGWFCSGGATNNNKLGGAQGGPISSVQVTAQEITAEPFVFNSKWSNITSPQRINGVVQYRCFYLKNLHATETATGLKFWYDIPTAAGDWIRFGYSGNPVNTEEQLINVASNEGRVYLAARTPSRTQLDNTTTRAGEVVDSTNAGMFDKALTTIKVWLQRHGNPPAGILSCSIRSLENQHTVLADFGNIDVATIAEDVATLYTFVSPSNSYKMKVGDAINLIYSQGTADDYITVYRNDQNPIPNAHSVRYEDPHWRNQSTMDLAGEFFYNVSGGLSDEIAPTGITFVDPRGRDSAIQLPNLAPGQYIGLWERRWVDAGNAAWDDNKYQVLLEYDSPI